MGIKLKNIDPKSTDFSGDDIVINHKDGKLFFKSDSDIIGLGVTSSYATTASYALNGGGGGSSFTWPDTGSFTTITASGDISSSGTIHALKIITNELTSSYVTSSTNVLFNNYTSSGNSLFGNGQDDTHTFTGHITSSDNISSSGNIYAVDYFDNDVNINTIYSPVAGHLSIATVGTIGTGTWNGDAITKTYIGADAIDGTKIEDDAVDTEHIANDAIDSEHYAAGSIDEAHIADNAVTLAKMVGGTDGNLISFDTNGNPAYVATGTSTHVLTSNGAGTAPTFQDAAGGGASSVTQSHYQPFQRCKYAGTFGTDIWYGWSSHNSVTWGNDFGNNAAVVTLAPTYAQLGFRAPYDCTLKGWCCTIGNASLAGEQITVALFTGSGAASTWNNNSGVADDLAIANVGQYQSGVHGDPYSPIVNEKLDLNVPLSAGDMVYVRTKKTGVFNKTYYFSDFRIITTT